MCLIFQGCWGPRIAFNCAQKWHSQGCFGSPTSGVVPLVFYGSFVFILRAFCGLSVGGFDRINTKIFMMFIRKLKGMYLIFQGWGGPRIAFICAQNWHPQDCFGSPQQHGFHCEWNTQFLRHWLQFQNWNDLLERRDDSKDLQVSFSLP